MRSLLFVPGDSEKKLGKATGLGADVLIVDLEDSVTAENRPAARRLTRDFVAGQKAATASALWVRINPVEGDAADARADLAAVMPAAPAGIMLPKAGGPHDVAKLSGMLGEYEREHGIAEGATRILPVASETPGAALALPDYAKVPLLRLAGLTWGAEDLSAAIGATRKRGPDGGWTSVYQHVRTQCLLAAHAAGVAAIDTLYADFRHEAGLAATVRDARADGFHGMLAIHPAQVAPINAGFAPSEEEIAHARAVIAAFDAQPGAGAVQLDGQMLDKPHLRLAERVLAQL